VSGRRHRSLRLGMEHLERREMLSLGPFPLASGTRTVTDDYGNTLAQAAQVSLSTAGAGCQSGRLETVGDVDVFCFVAPVTGQMTIRQQSSRTTTTLDAFTTSEQLLASVSGTAGHMSGIQISVTAGTTYYLKMSARGNGTGAYCLRFSTVASVADDYGNTLATATSVTLSDAGSGTQSGKIEKSGDADVFSFVAPTTGRMTIEQVAASGSRLDSVVSIYSSSGELIAQNDNNGSSRDSLVEFDVVAGTTYYVKASARTGSTGAYTLQFSTEETTNTPTEDGFQIDVTITGMTDAEEAIVEQAIARWEEVIVGDLPDVTYSGQSIDDVHIDISAITIDGSGSVLGQAAVTVVRSDSYLPCMGYIQLDTDDVADMLSDGSLLGVLEHEIAHVLGFGIIWSELGLLSGSRTSSPGFTGANAVAEYNALFGTSVTAVPVEADGGSGTALSHWDETVFDNELMTGWYNSGETNALSRITVASMADLGYEVNMAAADTYTAPTAASVSNSASSILTSSTSTIHALRVAAAIESSKALSDTSSLSNSLFGQRDQSRAAELIFSHPATGWRYA